MKNLHAWSLAALIACVSQSRADWPQFRGPERNGNSQETGLPLEWSAATNIVWKIPLPGPGSSSPIVFGDHVYVTCYTGYGLDLKAPGNLADLTRHIVCVGKKDGKILWTRSETDPAASDAPYKDGNIALHGYASHTPAADALGVYAYFGAAGAVGYSHTGEKRWRTLLGQKAHNHSYGSGASPLVHGDLLIVNASIETADLYRQGDTVALDKRTGREIWREKVGGEWSSPTLVAVNGHIELVVATRHPGPWVGLDPMTGKRLWECKGKDGCGTPVAHDGVVFTHHGEGMAAIRAGGHVDVTQTHALWEASGGARISSMVYREGHLYWTSDGWVANCTDVRSGKRVYRERLSDGGSCYASPLLVEGRIYYVTRDRGTYVVAAQPRFELLAHNKIEDDASAFNGSPAVSGRRLFLRSNRYLYCIGSR